MAIDVIRICGDFFIFLCHACSESGSSIGVALGQMFSVGVPIFSLYCPGTYTVKERLLQVS